MKAAAPREKCDARSILGSMKTPFMGPSAMNGVFFIALSKKSLSL
jgi:hypothetical protein